MHGPPRRRLETATGRPAKLPSRTASRQLTAGTRTHTRSARANIRGVTIETPVHPNVSPDRPAGSSLTVLYDEGCGVCRETVRQLRRWDRDGRMEFLPLELAASSGRPLLEKLAAEGHLADEIHVVNETTGQVVVGGHAALALLDALPGGWLLRPWAALPPTAAAADIVYRVASRHRDRLAWLVGMRNDVSCPIRPTGDAEDPNR